MIATAAISVQRRALTRALTTQMVAPRSNRRFVPALWLVEVIPIPVHLMVTRSLTRVFPVQTRNRFPTLGPMS